MRDTSFWAINMNYDIVSARKKPEGMASPKVDIKDNLSI